MPTIRIPHAISSLIGYQNTCFSIRGDNLYDCLQNLAVEFTELATYIYQTDGSISSYINIYLNGRDIRHLEHNNPQLTTDDEIEVILSLSGG